MTKDTPERWVYQFHKEPLGGGEYTEVYTFGPDSECESGRVEVREDYDDPCEARADAETLVRQIVNAHNATYATGINPDVVKDLVTLAESVIEFCVTMRSEWSCTQVLSSAVGVLLAKARAVDAKAKTLTGRE